MLAIWFFYRPHRNFAFSSGSRPRSYWLVKCGLLPGQRSNSRSGSRTMDISANEISDGRKRNIAFVMAITFDIMGGGAIVAHTSG